MNSDSERKFEMLISKLKFRQFSVKPDKASPVPFLDALEANLYQNWGIFRATYNHPEIWLSNGGDVVKCYDGDKPIGISILYKPNANVQRFMDDLNADGLISFYVNPTYRREGIGRALARRMKRRLNDDTRIVSTGLASMVVRTVFNLEQIQNEKLWSVQRASK